MMPLPPAKKRFIDRRCWWFGHWVTERGTPVPLDCMDTQSPLGKEQLAAVAMTTALLVRLLNKSQLP